MNLEKIANLNSQKKNIEIEIEERIEKEIREICKQFNQENKDVELSVIGGMGGLSLYIKTLNRDLSFFDDYFPNLDGLESEIIRFNENAIEYLNDEWAIKERNVDINNFNKLTLSDSLKNKYLQLLNVVEKIEFDISTLVMDSRNETNYEILDNGYKNTIQDERFLDLLSSSFNSVTWASSLARQLNWYSNSYPLKVYKNGVESENVLETMRFPFEKNFINNFSHKSIKEISKKLILESNLFNNTTDAFNECRIELKKSQLSMDLFKLFNQIRNDFKKSPEYAQRFLLTVGVLGKPSEVFGIDEKLTYLSNSILLKYDSEDLLSKDKSLLEDFSNPSRVLSNEENFTFKHLKFAENKYEEFKEFASVVDDFNKFTVVVNNLKDNKVYEKSFESFTDLKPYMGNEKSFLDSLVKNYEKNSRIESPESINRIKEEVVKYKGDDFIEKKLDKKINRKKNK